MHVLPEATATGLADSILLEVGTLIAGACWIGVNATKSEANSGLSSGGGDCTARSSEEIDSELKVTEVEMLETEGTDSDA